MKTTSLYRVALMDPDFRREPKTKHWCVLCQRDIKPESKYRKVMWELDAWYAIHNEDWEIADSEIRARRTTVFNPVEIAPVGFNCAKKLGLEFTRPA